MFSIFTRFRSEHHSTTRSRRVRAMVGLALIVLLGGSLFALLAGAGAMYLVSPTLRGVIHAVRGREISPDRACPGRDSITLLVIGADQDRDNKKRIIGTPGRSDTLMVVRFDFARSTAGIVSIPRDSRIRLPGYRGYRKINAAFALGGADLARRTVESLLGVAIDHVVTVNFDGFRAVVDTIGGVPVTVDKPLHYDDNWGDLHVHLEPGRHWLNGEQALGYVRIRKVDSDLHRAERQQQFLRAIKGRLANPGMWPRIPSLIEKARGALGTDLEDAQLLCLGGFIRNLPPESIQTATLTGREGPSFVYLDPDETRRIARELLDVAEAPLVGILDRNGDFETVQRLRTAVMHERRRGAAESRRMESESWRNSPPAVTVMETIPDESSLPEAEVPSSIQTGPAPSERPTVNEPYPSPPAGHPTVPLPPAPQPEAPPSGSEATQPVMPPA